MTDPSMLGDRAKALHDLADHPGWQVLRDDLDRAIEQWGRSLAKELMRGEPVNAEQIDHKRRDLIARRELLKQPRLAEERFTEALHQKGIT